MQITDVKINIMPGREPLKAFASITLDNCFVVHDLRVIKTEGRFFVAMPSKKIKDNGELAKNAKALHRDIAHPINSEMRSLIEKAVFERYGQLVKD